MQRERILNTTIKPLCLNATINPFTQAYALTAAHGTCEKGHLAYITDKTLYIEVNEIEACDDTTAEALLVALHSEAVHRHIMQVRFRVNDHALKQWAPALKAHGYQFAEGSMARWKNPSFNRDIAMGI